MSCKNQKTDGCRWPGCKKVDTGTGHHSHFAAHTCNPATAFVRVVDTSREVTNYVFRKEAIQKICPDCGKVISSVEVKNK